MQLKQRTLFMSAPAPGVKAESVAWYTQGSGVDKMCSRITVTRSDTTDSQEFYFSRDNGRTWGEKQEWTVATPIEGGMRRRWIRAVYGDPGSDRTLQIVMEGDLPGDDPIEGLKRWRLLYRVSKDGGRTPLFEEPIMAPGATPERPFERVHIGHNNMMMGDKTCLPITTRTGEILVPCQVTPMGPDGEYENRGGGYTYTEASVLIGKWRDDDRIDWELSDPVSLGTEFSTRGTVEPTIAELPDGNIMMVMRGSNDVRPELPGHKWVSASEDGGRTWSEPRAWTFDNGTPFYSPSSCSQLLRHSSGRYFWLGNLTRENPAGNTPRYPMVIGQLNPLSMDLVRCTVYKIDDRREGDPVCLNLSNFTAHEDRETGDILLYMARTFAHNPPDWKQGDPMDWTTDSFVYRMEV